MYISELELQGFKSFANKTKIRFDDGVTSIVGPNGCGKSNIVDSLRWVLGEQRPTLLRSSSMTNVIFNGTAQKKALGMAEVSLTLVNNRGVLPTEYNEVTIARRLYRSGDSEYLINGTVCRLKDIMELFMDTGMGSDAYSVIELKMVEDILDDRNNDRRRLFEEAAGVTKYKDKRKKTFRKLEETRKDLQRVDDILSEIRKNVRSLQTQASKAKKAKEFEEELRVLDLGLNKHEFEKVKAELDPLNERIDNAQEEKLEIQQELDKLEQAEEKARRSLTEKERAQSELQKKVNSLSTKVQENQTTLRITREKISSTESVIEQHRKDIEQTRDDLEELEALLEQNRESLKVAEKEQATAAVNLKASRERHNEIQKAHSDARSQLDEKNQRYQSLQTELNSLRNRKVKIESKLENMEEDLGRIEAEVLDLQEEIQRQLSQKKAKEQELEELDTEVETAEQAVADARQQRDTWREQQNSTKDTIRALQSKIDALESEIDLLEDIAKSNETFPESVQFLLEQHADHFSELAVVSDVFETEEELAVALESVLGPAANYLIVASLQEAKAAASLLKEEQKGTCTFIPLDQLQQPVSSQQGSLASDVRCDQRYDAVKSILLGHVQLVESVEAGYDQLATGQTGVTREGDIVTANRFLDSGSQGKNVGLRVGLSDKISKLVDRIDGLEAEKDEAEETLMQLTQNLDQLDINRLEQQLKMSEKQMRQTEREINSIESRVSVYQKNINELNSRKERQAGNEEDLKGQLAEIGPREDEIAEEIQRLNLQRQELTGKIAELEEERAIAQNRYNDARLKNQEMSNRVENNRRDIARAENGIESLQKKIRERRQQSEQGKEAIVEYQEEVATLTEQVALGSQQRSEANKELQEAEALCAKERGAIRKIEEDLKAIRKRKDVNTELVHHLTMSKNKLELKAETISDHIWETYELLMDQVTHKLPGDLAADDAKQRITYLKQRLSSIGTVNPLAIEEYEEEKERLDFYEDQINDLTEAEEKLMTTIEEINETATERFDEVFEKIRGNFVKVFKTLFHEDDYCDLVIDKDEEDPLEAKIHIKANPKGKRPSNISQLSGGEKTLTAIALLFAIYLVKPSPFCVLDEVDAPLDDANIERFAKMLKEFSKFTQFIIITHNKKTMSKAEMMYGVTMPETGVSRLVGVRLEDIEEFETN